MLKLKDLLALSPGEIRSNARSVSVYYTRGLYDWQQPSTIYRKLELKARDMKTQGKTKQMTFKFYGMSPNVMDDECWVHCNCEYFTFFLEVALTSQGSSSVINSNGAPPVEKNPNMMPYLCKHLIAACARIKDMEFKDPYGLLVGPAELYE